MAMHALVVRSRGVALYKGKVFVAAYDGRLIALDAATGSKIWEKDTLTDHVHSHAITGAPRVRSGTGASSDVGPC
jgi:quinohemoprotein ethanol dehydrogenase